MNQDDNRALHTVHVAAKDDAKVALAYSNDSLFNSGLILTRNSIVLLYVTRLLPYLAVAIEVRGAVPGRPIL